MKIRITRKEQRPQPGPSARLADTVVKQNPDLFAKMRSNIADLSPVGKGKMGHFVKEAGGPKAADGSPLPLDHPSHPNYRRPPHLIEFHRFRLMAIDPATDPRRMGLAVLSVPRVDTTGPVQPEFANTGRTKFKPRIDWAGTFDAFAGAGGLPTPWKDMPWRERCRRMVQGLDVMIQQTWNPDTRPFHHPAMAIIEIPITFQSAKGTAAAMGGDLLALGFCAAAISTYLTGRINTLEVDPLTWKGQLPKEVVHKRLREFYGADKLPKDPNALDAVGLAHWCLCQRTPAETAKIFPTRGVLEWR